MGTTLNGTTPSATYTGLLKFGDNTEITSSLKAISDGAGNDTMLELSTTALQIGGSTGAFWDDTNKRLGIGTNAPTFNIESKSVGNQLKASNPNDIYTYLEVSANGGQVNMKFGNGSGTTHFINNYSTGMWASNKFAFGPSFFTPSGQVHVKGSGTTFATTALLVEDSAGTDLLKIRDDGQITCAGAIQAAGFIGTAYGNFGSQSYNASVVLGAQSTSAGFLPPRMTTTQKNAISTPASGLMVYDTDLNQMSYYNGTTWVNI